MALLDAPTIGMVLAAGLTVTATYYSAQAQAFEQGHIQTLDITSTRGASKMDQIFSEDTSDRSVTRVCMVNLGTVTRAFTHAVQGINPMRAEPGDQTCANFSSADRVAYGMIDGNEPAQANRAMVMSLSSFAGGTVTFIWR